MLSNCIELCRRNQTTQESTKIETKIYSFVRRLHRVREYHRALHCRPPSTKVDFTARARVRALFLKPFLYSNLNNVRKVPEYSLIFYVELCQCPDSSSSPLLNLGRVSAVTLVHAIVKSCEAIRCAAQVDTHAQYRYHISTIHPKSMWHRISGFASTRRKRIVVIISNILQYIAGKWHVLFDNGLR